MIYSLLTPPEPQEANESYSSVHSSAGRLYPEQPEEFKSQYKQRFQAQY